MTTAATSYPAPLKVLYCSYEHVETLDLTGPLELLAHGVHDGKWEAPEPQRKSVFVGTLVSDTEFTTSNQKLTIKRDISVEEAYAHLSSFDVLVVPGGDGRGVVAEKKEPIGLITAFADLPAKSDGSTRYILSVCTGSLILAAAGVLDGLSATTHFEFYDMLGQGSGSEGKGINVMKERFVVNKVDEQKNLRIITSGGVSCGMDASLWLIGEVAGKEVADGVAKIVEYAYRDGVVL